MFDKYVKNNHLNLKNIYTDSNYIFQKKIWVSYDVYKLSIDIT